MLHFPFFRTNNIIIYIKAILIAHDISAISCAIRIVSDQFNKLKTLITLFNKNYNDFLIFI